MTHKTAADLHFAGIYLVKTANEGGGGGGLWLPAPPTARPFSGSTDMLGYTPFTPTYIGGHVDEELSLIFI